MDITQIGQVYLYSIRPCQCCIYTVLTWIDNAPMNEVKAFQVLLCLVCMRELWSFLSQRAHDPSKPWSQSQPYLLIPHIHAMLAWMSSRLTRFVDISHDVTCYFFFISVSLLGHIPPDNFGPTPNCTTFVAVNFGWSPLFTICDTVRSW